MSLEIFVYLCPNWYILTRRSCTYFVSSSRPWLQQSNKTNKIRNSWSWFGVNFTDDRYTINTSDHEFECDWLIPSTVTWLVTKRALIQLGYCKFVHFSSLEFCWLLDHIKRWKKIWRSVLTGVSWHFLSTVDMMKFEDIFTSMSV